MGLQLDSKTISLERRYMGLAVNKLPDGSVQSYITVQLGYYDNTIWIAVKTDTINLDNDTTAMLFGMKASHVGLNNPQLVNLMDKVIYGVIDGSIPTFTELTVNCNVLGQVLIRKGSIPKIGANTGTTFRTGVILGAVVEVSAAGYKTFTQVFPLLNGVKVLDVTLEPLEPAPTTEESTVE